MITALKANIFLILSLTLYIITSVLITEIISYTNSNGSVLKFKNKIIGSRLIAESYNQDRFLTPKPLYSSQKLHISGCSNSPFNLSKNKRESASGLDPHILETEALAQVQKIAKARGIQNQEVISIIKSHSHKRILNHFGTKITNTSEVNLELEKIYANETQSR